MLFILLKELFRAVYKNSLKPNINSLKICPLIISFSLVGVMLDA